MTQMAPSVLLYGQAILLIKELNDLYLAGGIKDNLGMDQKLQEILTRFEQNAGFPITEWDPISETEPPVSVKMNRFWRQVQSDVALLQHQVDIIRASSIFTYNLLSNDIEKASLQNTAIRNKIKTLQLYSDSVDSGIVVFADNFQNSEYIDDTKTVAQSRANIESHGGATLGLSGSYVNYSQKASLRIMPSSNGFPGNNQEVKDPLNAAISNRNSGEKNLIFIAEEKRASEAKAILDGSPSTWFEYEAWQVSDETKKICGDYGFSYSIDTSGIESYVPAPGENFVYRNDSPSVSSNTYVKDWSLGPENNVLKLDLKLDMRSVQMLNQITYVPFGLTDNVNLPVKITYVEISADDTNWTKVGDQNVWLATDVNISAARKSENVSVGKAVWRFEETSVRYVQLHIEQHYPIERPMGHIYWYDQRVPITTLTYSGRFNITKYAPLGIRKDGPRPYLPKLIEFYDPSNYTFNSTGSLIGLREWFQEKRWAIGIRDISLEQVKYNQESTVITKPIRCGGIVDRVLLEADVFVPSSFGSSKNWVSFFVSPDDGVTWHPIARIQDIKFNLPEVIAFNDPTPQAFQEKGVSYVKTSSDVTSVRLKIIISRPAKSYASSPIVKSYKLKIKRR